MPLLEKEVLESSIPTAKNCSLRQALQWISADIRPVPLEYEDALGIDSYIDLGNGAYIDGRRQLYAKLISEELKAFGYNVKNKLYNNYIDRISYVDVMPDRELEQEPEIIPAEAYPYMGVYSIDANRNCVQAKGIGWWDSFGVETCVGEADTVALWTSVIIDTEDLFSRFPLNECVETNKHGKDYPSQNYTATRYNTKLLSIVDKLRPQIAVDPSGWTRDAISAACEEIEPSLSQREKQAIGYVLLPDEKRSK